METKEKTAEIGSAAQLETSSTEKYDVASVDQEASSVGFSPEATKKLLRKTDLALLPFLALLYLLSFLDRTNIGNAKLARLEDDLGMNKKGYDYSVSCHR
jgi:hypothetical protein